MLLCSFCKRTYPVEDWQIKRMEDDRLYGGGGLFRATHRLCNKRTWLPAQMVKAGQIQGRQGAPVGGRLRSD